jgi:hypothetical protein
MADEINVTKTSAKYESHNEGQFVAKCVDTIDLGEKVSAFPGSPTKLLRRCAVVFRTGEQNSEGHPIDIAQEFTVSMHEKGNLRPFLERWRGKSYTEEQAEQGVRLDKLVGQPAQLTIEQKTSAKGRTYAAIAAISPLFKGLTVPDFPKYERAPYWEERKATYAQEAEAYKASINAPKPKAAPAGDGDDDLPF